MFSSAAWPMRLPTAVDPVKATLSMPGCAASAAPAVGPSPVTTFSAPGGNPASSASSARRSAVSGVSSAGLSTMAQPVASAGPIFHTAISSGKFHGMIAPTTPDRLAARVGEELVLAEAGQRRLHRRALDLGRPAGAVAHEVHGRRHVHALRDDERLAVVDGLDLGELGRVRLEQVGQLQQPALAIDRAGRAPFARLERGARRFHGAVHVGGAGRRHGGHHLAVAGSRTSSRWPDAASRHSAPISIRRGLERNPRHPGRGSGARSRDSPENGGDRYGHPSAVYRACTGPLSIGRSRNALGYALRGCVFAPPGGGTSWASVRLLPLPRSWRSSDRPAGGAARARSSQGTRSPRRRLAAQRRRSRATSPVRRRRAKRGPTRATATASSA